MRKIWVKKTDSFKKAEKFNRNYYMRLSRAERLDTVQFLREIYHKIKRPKNAAGKRLRRTIKIIQ